MTTIVYVGLIHVIVVPEKFIAGNVLLQDTSLNKPGYTTGYRCQRSTNKCNLFGIVAKLILCGLSFAVFKAKDILNFCFHM